MSRVERSVLGAILVDGRLYEQAAEIRSDDFSLDSHRRIFSRMGDLARTGRPIDSLTLCEELNRLCVSVGPLDALEWDSKASYAAA